MKDKDAKNKVKAKDKEKGKLKEEKVEAKQAKGKSSKDSGKQAEKAKKSKDKGKSEEKQIKKSSKKEGKAKRCKSSESKSSESKAARRQHSSSGKRASRRRSTSARKTRHDSEGSSNKSRHSGARKKSPSRNNKHTTRSKSRKRSDGRSKSRRRSRSKSRKRSSGRSKSRRRSRSRRHARSRSRSNARKRNASRSRSGHRKSQVKSQQQEKQTRSRERLKATQMQKSGNSRRSCSKRGRSSSVRKDHVQREKDKAESLTPHGKRQDSEKCNSEIEENNDSNDEDNRKRAKTNKLNKGSVAVEDHHKSVDVAPQRKAKVRCAALNDDEDFGDVFSAKVGDADMRRVSNVSPVAEESKEVEEQLPSKKEKEFAWMDSEDEGEGTKEAAKKDEDEGDAKDDDEEEVSIEVLDKAQSFGRMIILAPSLQKWLRLSRSPDDIVAVCKALARTRFFDGDIIAELYSVVRTLLRNEKLEANHTNEVLCCLKILNAYDRTVFGAIARAFRPKTRFIELGIRKTWMEIFQSFNHKGGDDFLQLLEVPPLLPNSPSYKRIRCAHHQKGTCVLDASCTYSHDPRAPLSLADGANEDWWRSKPLVMTQNQKTMGHGVYGVDRTTGTSQTAPAVSTPGLMPGMPGMAAAAVTAMAMAEAMAGVSPAGLQELAMQQALLQPPPQPES